MARLLINVEGPTEERFVNSVLREHLQNKGYHSVAARIVGDPRNPNRGGIVSWPKAQKDLLNHLREDGNAIVTTMVDYYGMPSDGDKAWPGRREAVNCASPFERAHLVQERVAEMIAVKMGSGFDPNRFVPFVVMHEYEALLFSDCTILAERLGDPSLAGNFQGIKEQFKDPEHINDSEETAPSKRIIKLFPRYKKQKPLLGVLTALQIGLPAIRAACPHFNSWINALESLAARP